MGGTEHSTTSGSLLNLFIANWLRANSIFVVKDTTLLNVTELCLNDTAKTSSTTLCGESGVELWFSTGDGMVVVEELMLL